MYTHACTVFIAKNNFFNSLTAGYPQQLPFVFFFVNNNRKIVPSQNNLNWMYFVTQPCPSKATTYGARDWPPVFRRFFPRSNLCFENSSVVAGALKKKKKSTKYYTIDLVGIKTA